MRLKLSKTAKLVGNFTTENRFVCKKMNWKQKKLITLYCVSLCDVFDYVVSILERLPYYVLHHLQVA